MNAPASNGGGAQGSATTHTNGIAELQEQLDLDGYRRQLATTAREAGEEGSRRNVPDAFAVALAAIEEVAATGWTFDADDVRAHVGPGFETVLGAVFATARRAGIIACAGYGISRSVSRHGALTRVWRRT